MSQILKPIDYLFILKKKRHNDVATHTQHYQDFFFPMCKPLVGSLKRSGAVNPLLFQTSYLCKKFVAGDS